ncbi:MAG TPA: hypothetical protein VFA26_03430 [Gemmataceae bacterium]|nr:hypothetical protein [Gemmataceae bacterium]
MIESPLIQELNQDNLLTVLRARFGSVPDEVVARLRKASTQEQLDELIRHAATCSNLAAFRAKLPSQRKNGSRRRPS